MSISDLLTYSSATQSEGPGPPASSSVGSSYKCKFSDPLGPKPYIEISVVTPLLPDATTANGNRSLPFLTLHVSPIN